MATLKFRDTDGVWQVASSLKYKDASGIWQTTRNLKYKDNNGVWQNVRICRKSSDSGDDYPTISTLTVGSTVYLNESGSPVEFYIAKHDYESGLNGTGRTLLVRKDCCSKRSWNSSNLNTYATSTIDAWLNGDYKALFDSNIQNAIATTSFYYTVSGSVTTVTELNRSVFLLSITELGKTSSNSNSEGTALDISTVLQTTSDQLTRTPSIGTTTSILYLTSEGNVYSSYCTSAYGVRPCFTLPANIPFNPNTNIIIG